MTPCQGCGGDGPAFGTLCPICGTTSQGPRPTSSNRAGGVSLHKRGGVSLSKSHGAEPTAAPATSPMSPTSAGPPKVSLVKPADSSSEQDQLQPPTPSVPMSGARAASSGPGIVSGPSRVSGSPEGMIGEADPVDAAWPRPGQPRSGHSLGGRTYLAGAVASHAPQIRTPQSAPSPQDAPGLTPSAESRSDGSWNWLIAARPYGRRIASLVAVGVAVAIITYNQHSNPTGATSQSTGISIPTPGPSAANPPATAAPTTANPPATAAPTTANPPATAAPTTANPPATSATGIVAETTDIPTWSGPNDDTNSDGSAVFRQVGSLAAGSTVSITCTVYGRPSATYVGSTSRLWDYTSQGYVPDSAMNTGSNGPVAPGCFGTLAQPRPGSGAPSQEAGPYPLYNKGTQVDVFDSPSTSANIGHHLVDGTYVHLVCSSQGSPVLGPTDMNGTSVGTSTDWDKIDAPFIGWVSDVFIDSNTENSVAPKC
jgi:hypothetical protein